MGAFGGYCAFHSPFVGKEFHAVHRLFHRLCADVQQVPCRVFHLGDCRIYHSFVRHVGFEGSGDYTCYYKGTQEGLLD